MEIYKYKNATSSDLLKVCDKIAGPRYGMLPSDYLNPWLT
jgi:hypothetical protein